MSLLIISLTLLAAAIMGIIFAFKPTWGLVTLIYSLPFERIGQYSLNPHTGYPEVHIAQVVGGALIGAYFLHLVAGLEKPRKLVPIYFLLAFDVFAFASALSVHVQQVWSDFVWLLFITALFFVTAQLVKKENLEAIKKAALISAGIVCLFGIYQYLGDIVGLSHHLTGIRREYSKEVLGFPRLQSTALEPLYFANYLMVPLLIGLALQISGLMKKRWELIVLGIIGLAFLLTQSRGGYYSLAAGIVYLAWLLREKLKGWLARYYKQMLLAVAGLLLISLATVAASSLKTNHNLTSAPHYLIQLFSTKLTETGSFTERVRDQELAFSIFKKHPLLGVGIGGFGSSVYGCTVGKCVYRPNNQALEVLAEGGIVGFLAFHAFLLAILYYGYQTFKRHKNLQMALAAGISAAIVAMVIQSQSFSGFLCCLTHPWADLAILAGLGSLPAVVAEAKKE